MKNMNMTQTYGSEHFQAFQSSRKASKDNFDLIDQELLDDDLTNKKSRKSQKGQSLPSQKPKKKKEKISGTIRVHAKLPP